MPNAKELWAEATVQDGIAHQRDAQLTWWSILQGIAMGEFIMRLPTFFSDAWRLKEYYVFAFIVATFLLLVNVWVQMAWAIIILRWPLSITHVMLTSVLGIVCVFLTETVMTPLQWLEAAIVLGITGVGGYAYNWVRGAYTWRDKKARWAPIVETIIYVVVLGVIAWWVHGWPTQLSFYASGVIALIVSGIALRSQSVRMKKERKAVHLP